MHPRFGKAFFTSLALHTALATAGLWITLQNSKTPNSTPPPVQVEMIQLTVSPNGSSPEDSDADDLKTGDLTEVTGITQGLTRSLSMLQSFNLTQTNCSNDRGQNKLCARALWSKIEKFGLRSLSDADCHFVSAIQRVNQRGEAFAQASVAWLRNGKRTPPPRVTHLDRVVDPQELERYWAIMKRVKEAGLKHLSPVEQQAWNQMSM